MAFNLDRLYFITFPAFRMAEFIFDGGGEDTIKGINET